MRFVREREGGVAVAAPRRRGARIAVYVAVACLLAAFAGLYRFNTLGGRFGGFDNDHFVPFAYAKQMQAGEQPLTDFDGLGLQGAWPSLTYEVSSLAQQWLGNNLRSDALVTIGGVALAAALTFAAAASVSSIAWAAPATLVSIFVAPTLYNYSKVLTFAAFAVAIVAYGRRPGRVTVAVAAVLAAAAFLFRHDYFVYVSVGMVIACLAAGPLQSGVRHALLYVGLSAALLAPSLVYVQRHEGLLQYFSDSLVMSRREAERTTLTEWPHFSAVDETGRRLGWSVFGDDGNAVAWLYYGARLLPFAALVLVLTSTSKDDVRHRRAAVLALAGMSAFAVPFLVRGNVAVRLGDIGPLCAVLAAFVFHEATKARGTEAIGRRVGRGLAVAVLCVPTALSTMTVGAVHSQLGVAGMRESLGATVSRSQQLWTYLEDLPASAITGDVQAPFHISHYLNRCTRPDDRVVMMTYEPELLPFAGRRFGAGRLSILPNYALNPRQQQVLVSRWQRQSVPLVLVEFSEFWDPSSPSAPIVRDYLLARYEMAGSLAVRDDKTLRVFAERGRTPVSVFGPSGLPCFA